MEGRGGGLRWSVDRLLQLGVYVYECRGASMQNEWVSFNRWSQKPGSCSDGPAELK